MEGRQTDPAHPGHTMPGMGVVGIAALISRPGRDQSMADNSDSGDKTERPTPKKLKDARKKGQVAKSRDVTSTAGLAAWLLLAVMALGWAAEQIGALVDAVFVSMAQPFETAAPELASQALRTLLSITAVTLLPVAAVGLLSEFLQAGPVFTLEKLTPKFENIDPVAGLKRMFSMDNLIEVVKAIAKTAVLLAIGWLAVKALLPQLAQLPWTPRAASAGAALWATARPVLAWTVVLFALLSVLDAAYQRWNFMKKMRMSLRDIKQEHKEQEGDPYIKGHRRQLHEEWSQRNAAGSARNANVLVVNPTHVAIAIDYDRALCPVPMVAAKGEDHVARAMREAAQEAGVPIVRNIPLARDLLARAEVGELIPADLFDVIAEVILWAREVRDELEDRRRASSVSSSTAPHTPDGTVPPQPKSTRRRGPPGEDLTRYPDAYDGGNAAHGAALSPSSST